MGVAVSIVWCCRLLLVQRQTAYNKPALKCCYEHGFGLSAHRCTGPQLPIRSRSRVPLSAWFGVGVSGAETGRMLLPAWSGAAWRCPDRARSSPVLLALIAVSARSFGGSFAVSAFDGCSRRSWDSPGASHGGTWLTYSVPSRLSLSARFGAVDAL